MRWFFFVFCIQQLESCLSLGSPESSLWTPALCFMFQFVPSILDSPSRQQPVSVYQPLQDGQPSRTMIIPRPTTAVRKTTRTICFSGI